MKRSHLAREIVELIALALLIFLALHFTIQNYQIDDSGMQNALSNGQFVLVNKAAYLLHSPERGDVIVFHEPDDPGRDLIKRIIGLSGDTITVDGTNVWVNGVELNEPYVDQKYNPGAQSWTVPKNSYFVMGDNRPNSRDSRIFGFVPGDYIVGKAVLVYWPLNQWQFINTYSSVYSHVK